MYININNIEILDLIQKEQLFFNSAILIQIDTSNKSVDQLLNDKDLYKSIYLDLLMLPKDSELNFVYLDSIDKSKKLILVYDLYSKILEIPEVINIGDMSVSIGKDEIIITGHSPIENWDNIVYNLLAIKILLDYKRRYNAIRHKRND